MKRIKKSETILRNHSGNYSFTLRSFSDNSGHTGPLRLKNSELLSHVQQVLAIQHNSIPSRIHKAFVYFYK